MSCFTDGTEAVLFVALFCYLCFTFVLVIGRVCSLKPCDHLMGKDGHLGSLVCDVSLRFVILSLSHVVYRVRCGS